MGNIFDVVVIGAGPSGMMAAGTASLNGARVILLEKNEEPGKKLLITGNGRCNLAYDEQDPLRLSEHFGKNGRFLIPAFRQFGLLETLDFFSSRGLETVREKDGKIFPAKGSGAYDVRRVLLEQMRMNGVTVMTRTAVITLEQEDGRINRALTERGTPIEGNRFIIATGGLSCPSTGSTGDGYLWAENLGHTVTRREPSISPVRIKESFCRELMGITLRDVTLSVTPSDGRSRKEKGEVLFTHFGISGPMVMNLSPFIAEGIKKGTVTLSLDLLPHIDPKELDDLLLRGFREIQGGEVRSVLRELIPRAVVSVLMRVSGVAEDQRAAQVARGERQQLVETLKGFTLTPTSLLGYKWAVVTRGGISLKEVNPDTMASKKISNLFFAGEVLDVDGPTGGFNLQACWSTGFIAGRSAFSRLSTTPGNPERP